VPVGPGRARIKGLSPTRRPARRLLAAPVRAWLRGLALLMVIGLAAVVVAAPSLTTASASVAVATDADVAPSAVGAAEADDRVDDESSDDALLVPAATAPPRAALAFAYTRVARVPAARTEPPSLPPPEG